MLPAVTNLPGDGALPPAASAFLPVAASIPYVAALRLCADDALLKRDAVNTERATANIAALLDQPRERLDALDDLIPGLVDNAGFVATYRQSRLLNSATQRRKRLRK